MSAAQVAELARRGDWAGYFTALRRDRNPQPVDGAVEEEDGQPAAEHTTRDPWPEGFGVPGAITKLEKLARDSGWEAMVGYSRAARKKGRGKVGGTGDARWVLHHYVKLQLRHPATGARGHWVIYTASAEEDPLKWTQDGAYVNGRPSNVTAFRELAKSRPA